MKLRRRRQSEVPPKIKSFINGVIAVPLENIEEPLKSFFWDFDKGDFHHWVDLFNHFDTFFEKYIKPRKDLQLDDGFLESDPPFPREAVLQILRVVRTILDNCTNKHFYSSYEHHLSSLLASTDADVVEACLQTLSSFLRKSIGKHIARDTSLSSKLFAFAQGWGGKDEGLGLVACALENVSDPVAHELGSTLHFEFYDNSAAEKSTQGLQIIHLPNINTYEKPDLELLHELIEEYKVPSGLRFSLLARLRFSRAFSSFTARQQYTCIRLHAFIVLVQACGDSDDLVSFFNTEPEFINELVALLSYEDAVPEKIRILSLYSLAALSQDRSRQPTVLTAVTSGGHRGILSSLMQKAIDTVVSKSSKSSVLFAEALLSLVTVLVSSSSGCSAMREAGFIPTLLPLLKDTDSQHLHLVSTAVHVLEAFMDYSNPAAALFRDLGGLDDTISRLKIEVSHVENGTSVQIDSSSSSSEPLYSEAMVSYHRRSLMKALLRAISLGTYAPGTTARVYGSEESLLPQCLHVIFKKAKDFGGGMFSLAAVVMSDLIHKDPTCYSILEQAALPSAFLDAIMDGVLCSAEAITCIPQCLDALCLSNNGLQAVKDRNALRCFVKIFTSRNYLRALMGDTPSSLSSGLDELMRHASSLRVHGVDMLIEILKTIEKLGSGVKDSFVPMETDGESSKTEDPEKLVDSSADTSVEDDELARALALSLGNSSETPKADNNAEKSTDVQTEAVEAEAKTPAPSIDDILAATMKLFQSSDSLAFPLTDLLVTFCNRNKGEDRPKVMSYLIQQLKLCPLETAKETSTLCMISHTLALFLTEDVAAREIAVKSGIVSISIDILTKFLAETESQNELTVPKCISALLLILDNLSQSKPKISSDSKEVTEDEEKSADEENSNKFEKMFGKSTGYLTVEEGSRVVNVACDLIKQHVPAMVMQAVLLLCARLTKTHTLALQFLENGGMVDLFNIPKTCFFPGYDTVASAIIRHLIEDPQTLQTAMELEVRQALSGSRHGGRVPPRVFLTSMAPLISRDPEVFMKATTAVCQLDTTGGRTVVVLSKEKEKEKDKAKAQGVEIGPENKSQDTQIKCGKSQKKIPANLTQVVDHLLEIVMKYPSPNLVGDSDCARSDNSMEVDGSAVNKGKMKVDDTPKEYGSLSEKQKPADGLAKVTFVLKLLSDILLMYVHAIPEGVENGSGNEIAATDDAEQHHEGTNQDEGDHDHESNLNESADPELRIEMDEMEDGGVLRDSDQIEMTFHVESRGGGDNTGDEDDEMGDDGEDEEDDDDGDDEDEDIAEDGTALMSLADTDVEDHDETGLGDEYNDEMVDDEDDDYHENRVIEVRWREALDGVLGQPGAESGLIDIAAEPFEGVNVDDLFGLRRPIGFDRRRQQSRTSFERTGTDGNNHNSLQHPLLLRPPSQSGELGPMWSSGGGNGNSSRDLESLSGGSFDVSHFYMFDAPVLPFDPVQSVQSTVFGDRSGGGAPPLADFSVGLESLRAPTRRGPGDGRWTDDGQPQAGGQAAAIAQAVEEHFMSQLNTTTSLANDNQPVADAVNNDAQQTEVPHEENDQNVNQVAENVEQTPEGQASGPSPDATNNTPDSHDNMEIGEANVNEQQELSTPDEEASNNTRTSGELNADVDMNNAAGGDLLPPVGVTEDSLSEQNTHIEDGQTGQTSQADDIGATNIAQSTNGIDPTFLEALPAELRAEVLASQQAQSVPPPVSAPAPTPATAEEIDPEFLAALPPDIQAEVLAQQRAQRVAHQAEGQPVDMDNASIIATFPADLREEVLLTSSEAVLSALPSPLLAEAQMLRDRAMSHYQARSLFGNSHRLNNRRNGLGFDRQTVIDRGVGVTVGRRASSALLESLKVKEVEGDPLLDPDALKALIRLLRLAQPLGKGLLQRLFLNLCAHSYTRAVLVFLLLGMIKIETEGPSGGLTTVNSQRLYGCQSNVVYGRSQLLDGLPPLVLRRVLEILTYLATNHSSVASLLFHFDSSLVPESLNVTYHDKKNDKGKEKVVEEREISHPVGSDGDIPILLLVKLLNQPLFLRSIAHLEQVMGLLQVVVYNAASKLESQSTTEQEQAVASSQGPPGDESASNPQHDSSSAGAEPNHDDTAVKDGLSTSDGQKHVNMFDIFMKLPHSDLQNLCSLLGHEGLSDKVYLLAGEVLKKLASVAPSHRKFFITELSDLAHSLSGSAIRELVTLRNTHMLGLSAGSMAGAAVLRILQTLSSLTLPDTDVGNSKNDDNQEHVTMWKLNHSLEPLWQELSECISVTETQLAQGSFSSVISDSSSGEHAPGAGAASLSSLPPGTQRLLPFIESFLVLCEKLQANNTNLQQDDAYATAREGKEVSGSSSPSGTGIDGAVTFAKFAEKHRRLLNAFVRQNPGLLEKSLSMMLKAPRLIDFDNKRLYFRSRIRQQHDQHLTGPLRISVRRAYVLEDSYNQLRMRPTQELKGRLNVHFQGEEGIDAGGLTREWYQLLSRVIFDKGALLFTTGGNNATFQPNPNSVYQTEHLSYFKFVGRVVAKALFDGQLLDVYFTRSFYKHILGVKVTYHDIEAVDPDYYKNLKWLLENDVSDILDLTFSMDADEEKHILYEKTEVTDYELKPGGRNIRVTEETKHEYVDLVAEHILTNAIRPQINSFLEGFNELIPRELISIFNDKELELLISGLPEIDLDDLKANTEYTGYTIGSSVVTWFWEVVNAFNKEDRARLLQFVTGTSKVPLEGFKALQGISGPQRFQIHKAYGAPERLPSAHTCFNQLDLPEYTSKEQLQERLLLAIHEASEGFGFG
ncbi:putative HECT domain, armadillo-like helical, HECT, E3 ligase catalytic domain-containing protein [Helianthus annuus]|nr:putative HECT domain, armadillo-like helical, HECT, E3 ligase catalytic domain-containing protein [Helianthus annuus]